MGETKKPAHQALYRKYRSKSLAEIVGQEHITKTLENAIKQGKISHAYLFTGPRGVGKTSIARILAHEINNLAYTDERAELDIIEIDAASNRRIDDIRDLREKVHIAPVHAKYKVYIIDEVHMLTNESFNALLKTLEEPPEHVIFILATTEVHKLPATIISRTQRHGFRSIPIEVAAKHLKDIAAKENITIDDAALQLLAEHGGGSFRDSISLLDQLSSSLEPINTALVELTLGLAPKNELLALLTAVKNGDGKAIITHVEQLLQGGLTAGGVASQLLKMLREDAKKSTGSKQIVTLMSNLLEVQSAHYPELKLETILLGFAARDEMRPAESTPTKTTLAEVKVEAKPSAPKLAQKPLGPVPEAKAGKSKELAVEKKLDDVTTTPPSQPNLVAGDDIIAEWSKVLDATKLKNNPLYTVLRLATPELNHGRLLLIFSFPFHQKKVEESKHKALISEIIADITGQSLAISTLVDKKRAKPVNSANVAPLNDAHASLISSVQDIMGGGEVVNV